jgi:hypothetical protein
MSFKVSCPFYHFDAVTRDGTTLRDQEGVNLPDLDAAKREARHDAVHIACERGPGDGRTIIKVRDQEQELFTVTVRLLVDVTTSNN